MPKVARVPADVREINYGEHVFQFEDGTRQVSEAEEAILKEYERNGGPVKVEITETKGRK